MTRRFWAFTLAETLIVMGIIGVVAALTVPNLNASTGEKEKVAKVKKIYKDLNDAYGRAVAVYGPVDEWFAKDTTVAAQSTRFGERMLDFLKVSKNCKTESGKGCFYNDYYGRLYNGSSPSSAITYETNTSYYKVITSDGASIAFSVSNSSFGTNYALSCPGPYCKVGIDIAVDIDGPTKGAHRQAKDFFSFYVDKEEGVIPKGGMAASIVVGGCFTMGEYCTGWVIQNDNMDYLKATNGTCPNATVLSWTNTSCK